MNIAVLAGDGIGPEIVDQALNVVKLVCKKFNHELSYKEGIVGATAIDKTGNPYPDETHELCMNSDAVLLEQLVILNMIIIHLPKLDLSKDY